jgi:uncharacterized membrane protein YkvI
MTRTKRLAWSAFIVTAVVATSAAASTLTDNWYLGLPLAPGVVLWKTIFLSDSPYDKAWWCTPSIVIFTALVYTAVIMLIWGLWTRLNAKAS